MKNIKSTDPRKAAIVAALKEASGCRKVTSVAEIAPGLFQGTCMWPFDAHMREVRVAPASCIGCGTTKDVVGNVYPLCESCKPNYLTGEAK